MTEGSKSGPSEVKRYVIRHLIDEDNVLDWPRDLRRGPDVVLASDYDSLRTQLSAVEAERDALREALKQRYINPTHNQESVT